MPARRKSVLHMVDGSDARANSSTTISFVYMEVEKGKYIKGIS